MQEIEQLQGWLGMVFCRQTQKSNLSLRRPEKPRPCSSLRLVHIADVRSCERTALTQVFCRGENLCSGVRGLDTAGPSREGRL